MKKITFFNQTLIKAGTADEIVPSTGGSELIQRFWTNFNKWKNKLGTTPPTPKIDVLGYDQNTRADTVTLRSVFMNGHDVQTYVVEEGMWMGNNIGQTADYAGTQQTIMMKEIRSGVYDNQLDEAKKQQIDDKEEFELYINKGLDSLTQKEYERYSYLYIQSHNGENWDLHLAVLISKSAIPFFKETNPWRNMQYDYWIRTLVRWFFHLRGTTTSWNSALGKYNPNSSTHKKTILARLRYAQLANEQNKKFYPKETY